MEVKLSESRCGHVGRPHPRGHARLVLGECGWRRSRRSAPRCTSCRAAWCPASASRWSAVVMSLRLPVRRSPRRTTTRRPRVLRSPPVRLPVSRRVCRVASALTDLAEPLPPWTPSPNTRPSRRLRSSRPPRPRPPSLLRPLRSVRRARACRRCCRGRGPRDRRRIARWQVDWRDRVRRRHELRATRTTSSVASPRTTPRSWPAARPLVVDDAEPASRGRPCRAATLRLRAADRRPRLDQRDLRLERHQCGLVRLAPNQVGSVKPGRLVWSAAAALCSRPKVRGLTSCSFKRTTCSALVHVDKAAGERPIVSSQRALRPLLKQKSD